MFEDWLRNMEMVNANPASSPEAHVVQIASPRHLSYPSRRMLEDRREYLQKCVPLYKLALRGDWNEAKRMIDADTSLLNAAITKEWGTLLHVVAGTNHVHFVNHLVKLLNPDDLALQNFNGNTAFCHTAASGNMEIAAIMIKKNEGLPKIRGGEEATPLYIAVLQGKGEMARHLYPLTTSILEEDDWTMLFFLCIKTGLYDIALQILQQHSMLALARDENYDTGLHLLARKTSDFSGRGQWYHPNQILNSSMKATPFVQLVDCLWSMLLEQYYDETALRTFISHPSQITFDATQVGNFEFLATLMRSYPDLLWEVDEKNRSIIHIAVLHRHSTIYSLIYELGSIKDFIATFEDDEGNSILHYAAMLTPPEKLSLISGAALQMTHELLWFQEVKKIMLLVNIEKKNAEGKSAREIFAEKHKELLTKAESWTKSTAINCMLVSALITTGVFTATFMVPGGNNKNSGSPNYLQEQAFLVFSLSVACALISASASILMFLSIFISSYAEDECFKSLPYKLLFGMWSRKGLCENLEISEMAMEVRSTTNPEELQIVIHKFSSAECRSPSCDLLQNTKDYVKKCAPIYNLAIKGDWKEARTMLLEDSRLATAAISQGWATLLHVAAEANHLHFVEELVKELSQNDLEIQDFKGNTAFCFAAAVGNVKIAEAMARRNRSLPTIRGGQGLTPLHLAALQGKSEMAWYLYPSTVHKFDDKDWNFLFFHCIDTGIYDLALKMLQDNPILAVARNENQETGLHVLARKPSAFSCQGRRYPNQLMSSRKNPSLALQLVRCLWNTLLSLDCTEIQMKSVINEPSQVIFIAAEVGNFEILAELVRSYPDLTWDVDAKNRSIIHIAVLHRHATIFNLIHEIRSIRNFLVTYEDADQNNLLHCAAKLAPPSQLNLVSGAAFQMMHELRWYEEVKMVMPPSLIEKRNSNGKTPRELFTEEHTELLTRAECWMKSMVNSCMLVSTLIATEVFTAAFSLPRGDDDKNGNPNCNAIIFIVFAISDATALISSSISILIFLSMLTIARYAEDDFFKSLPMKLICGLVTLFISIASMMIAFSSAFFITYYHGLKWVPIFISVVALAPITLFTFLLFPLWSDIVDSAYFSRFIFRPKKHVLY
ncbi:unnamed protein product [Sphenostylis stenocarpa]|uniref:PGG domain-containing protein n=1 Tax=Sphenostylis stenocarpa TaxID=92480 RepID=A0AA86SZS4_9FABA|nr:unnamed protein product [Sphenostylis stenocarpa]